MPADDHRDPDQAPSPPPWEVNELVYQDDEQRYVAELAEQLKAEREDIYGDPVEDVRVELENRSATDGPYDLSEIVHDENGMAAVPADWDLDGLSEQLGDVPLTEVELPPEERAQLLAEVAARMSPEEFAEYAGRSMSEPEQPERDAYDDQEFGGPERMSVEQRDRLVELEAQNDLMQQRADAEDLADQLLEEATHHAAENPDNAAALVSIADELRAARIYLEQRTERAEHHEEPTSGPDAAQLAEEQQHRESARVLSEREQPQQERGIER